MFPKCAGLTAIGLAVLLAGPVQAQEKEAAAPPAVVQAVLDCRTVADEKERLACFDRTVDGLDRSVAAREVVVADREQVREARKGIFGLNLSGLGNLLSKGDEPELSEVTDVVTRYRQDATGRTILTLSSGAVWRQVDTDRVRVKEGSTIRIRKASLGSYLANIDNSRAIRVRRIVD